MAAVVVVAVVGGCLTKNGVLAGTIRTVKGNVEEGEEGLEMDEEEPIAPRLVLVAVPVVVLSLLLWLLQGQPTIDDDDIISPLLPPLQPPSLPLDNKDDEDDDEDDEDDVVDMTMSPVRSASAMAISRNNT